MKPLFMWAGGKKKLIKSYESHLPLKFNKYHEPFFGGGALFVWAYGKNPDASFYINDINPHIIGVYKAIKEDASTFCKLMDRLQEVYISLPGPEQVGKQNKELQKKYKLKNRRFDWEKIYNEQKTRRHFYFKIRDRYAWNYERYTPIQEAAILYFLMKTGFNGVWQINTNTNNRFGTPCGLLNHKDAVYEKENVLKWQQALQKCQISSMDFKKTLKDIGKDSFVFLDPPYRGGFADYGTKKDDDFQEEVIKFLNDAAHRGAYSLLSNRDLGDDFFNIRAGNNQIHTFNVSYTVGRRKKLLNEDGEEAKDKNGNPLYQEAKKAKEILMIAKK